MAHCDLGPSRFWSWRRYSCRTVCICVARLAQSHCFHFFSEAQKTHTNHTSLFCSLPLGETTHVSSFFSIFPWFSVSFAGTSGTSEKTCCPQTRRSRSHWPDALQQRSGPWPQGAVEGLKRPRNVGILSTKPSKSEGQSFWDNQIIPNNVKLWRVSKTGWKRKQDHFGSFDLTILQYFYFYIDFHGQEAAFAIQLLTSCR